MNVDKRLISIALQKINFTALQRYLVNRNWERRLSKREHLTIFYISIPAPNEILLPLDRGFSDYDDLILNALTKISRVENREIEQVINDLLLPPSDVIRFRVAN